MGEARVEVAQTGELFQLNFFEHCEERIRFAPQSDDAAHLRLFDVRLPEREQNGVILAPGTATLRIQE